MNEKKSVFLVWLVVVSFLLANWTDLSSPPFATGGFQGNNGTNGNPGADAPVGMCGVSGGNATNDATDGDTLCFYLTASDTGSFIYFAGNGGNAGNGGDEGPTTGWKPLPEGRFSV